MLNKNKLQYRKQQHSYVVTQSKKQHTPPTSYAQEDTESACDSDDEQDEDVTIQDLEIEPQLVDINDPLRQKKAAPKKQKGEPKPQKVKKSLASSMMTEARVDEAKLLSLLETQGFTQVRSGADIMVHVAHIAGRTSIECCLQYSQALALKKAAVKRVKLAAAPLILAEGHVQSSLQQRGFTVSTKEAIIPDVRFTAEYAPPLDEALLRYLRTRLKLQALGSDYCTMTVPPDCRSRAVRSKRSTYLAKDLPGVQGVQLMAVVTQVRHTFPMVASKAVDLRGPLAVNLWGNLADGIAAWDHTEVELQVEGFERLWTSWRGGDRYALVQRICSSWVMEAALLAENLVIARE